MNIFRYVQDEHIVKDWHDLKANGFEGYVINRLAAYYGKTQEMLKRTFHVESTAKNINEVLSRMLDVDGKIAYTNEFQNASIVPKTIRVQFNGTIKESSVFSNIQIYRDYKKKIGKTPLYEIILSQRNSCS